MDTASIAQFPDINNIVEATVPKPTLQMASASWYNLDQLGPTTSFIDKGLGALNKAIIAINQIR
jgi:hypothetical protein